MSPENIDGIALRPERKSSQDSLGSLLLQTGAPSPGEQSTQFVSLLS